MTKIINDVFPKQSSCGFKKDVGYWEIDLGTPENTSAAFLNELTISMVASYLEAFSSLSRPVEFRYDRMRFGKNRELKSNQEGEVQRINPPEASSLLKELTRVIANPFESILSALIVECELRVYVPRTENCECRTWVPGAGQFYVGYVFEPDNEDSLLPVDSSLRFDTTIDVWVQRTQNPISSEAQDNRVCAARNQPLLESALKAWEALIGKPIVESGSRYYRDQIYRYGFRKL